MEFVAKATVVHRSPFTSFGFKQSLGVLAAEVRAGQRAWDARFKELGVWSLVRVSARQFLWGCSLTYCLRDRLPRGFKEGA